MHPNRFESIAQKLEGKIASGAIGEMPSIRALAIDFEVSYPTMWKAIQLLIKKGTITAQWGKRIVITKSQGVLNALPCAADQLYAKISSRIADGRYLAGRQLPKIGYFSADEHCSPHTVSQALLMLEKDARIYRQGRRWFVGSGKKTNAQSSGSAPVVLLLVTDHNAWVSFFESPITNPFSSALAAELTRASVQLLPVLMFSDTKPYPVAFGLTAIETLIRELRDRYIGTIVVGVNPLETELENFIRPLVLFGKPVVYLDHANKGAYIHKNSFVGNNRFLRMHTNEFDAVKCALRELHDRGHRIIGVHGAEQFDWAQRRLMVIRECVRNVFDDMSIVTAAPAEQYWGFSNWSGMHDFITAIAGQPPAVAKGGPKSGEIVASFQHALVKNASSMVNMLVDSRPTAILALSDRMAREYYFWCTTIGISIPRQLSIVSFDNLHESIVMPISTIDFGLAELGYSAAHHLIGDVPLKTALSGTYAGNCRMVDRGSIALPDASLRYMKLLA